MQLNKILAFIVIYVFNISHAGFNIQTRPYESRKRPFKLDEAIDWHPDTPSFVNQVWSTDDELYHYTEDSIVKYNVDIDSYSTVLSPRFLSIENYLFIKSFSISSDRNRILIRYNYAKKGYPELGRYDAVDLTTRRIYLIQKGLKLQYCAWSPTSNQLVYVYNNNIYIYFERDVFQITTDGVEGVIYNGIPDSIYRKQVLNGGSALWWSPDGMFLAFAVFNNTHVRDFQQIVYGESEDPQFQYPKMVHKKYPKSGTNSTEVTLKIFDFKTNETYNTIQAPIKRISSDHILKSVAWTLDNKLLVTWLNRYQNIASLQLCTVSGECREVKRIEEPKGWIDIGTTLCLKNTQSCLFIYWIGNWRQVWKLNLETGENMWPSRGNFTVLKVYGYDEINDKLYFQATFSNDASIHHVYSNNYCLTCTLHDRDSHECYSAEALFSTNYTYYLALCNGPNPSYTELMRTKNKLKVGEWDTNEYYHYMLGSKQLPIFTTQTVPLADGSSGMIKLIYPPHLDIKRKYPMIIYVNGYPGSVVATNEFRLGFQAFMTTNREVVYVEIDGRGTGDKGKELLFSVINHLGEFEVDDIMFVTKYLIKELTFVDKDRCGIWGWNYGGYLTALTLASDSENVFQCGISVAPITSWLYSDSIYTEKFMGMPVHNMEKYVKSSVLNEVEHFRKHDFLLVYGTGDSLVHHQHSIMLAKVLQENDILYEELIYPDEDFATGTFTLHMYHSMNRFWSSCFNLVFDE